MCWNQNIHYPTMHHDASVCACMCIYIYMCVQVCWPTSIVQPLQEKWLKIYRFERKSAKKGNKLKPVSFSSKKQKEEEEQGAQKLTRKRKITGRCATLMEIRLHSQALSISSLVPRGR